MKQYVGLDVSPKEVGAVVCIDACAAHKALSARLSKSDRVDAAALARLVPSKQSVFDGDRMIG